MQFLTELWLPIVVAAVAVFVVSSVIHMVLPIHKGDMAQVPNEAAVLEAMKANGVGPGCYMFPFACSMKEMGSPEMQDKLQNGPSGFMTIAPPGGFGIGKSLLGWFIYSLLIGVICAYIGWLALGADTTFLAAFRVIGACAVLGYAVGAVNDSLWKGAPWKNTAKFMFDGFVYALVTAGIFGWLWPIPGA